MGSSEPSYGSSEGVFAARPDRVAALLELGTSGDGEFTSGTSARRPGPGDEVPPDVPGYEITGKLGEGGMGTVWRAVQLSTRREIALKLVGSAATGSHRARLRFDREVELAARLEHPHIARVYDSGMSRGLHYYAMELVEGRHLDRYVQEEKLDRKQILSLFRDVCLAVQHAHQRGVIHRDLKPSNVLVTSDGRPKVLDFGLGKAVEESEGGLTLTVDGHWAGTPAFMAPEQAAGDARLIDTRTDVWGLGATLFRLLTGEAPHDTSGPRHAVMRRAAEEEVLRPRQFDRRMDAELEAVLLKALAREPERRYESAGALARDVERYLEGRPVAARPPSAAYLLRKWVARHRIGVVAGAIISATVGGSVLLHRQVVERRVRQENRARDDLSTAFVLFRSFEWRKAAERHDALIAAGVDDTMTRGLAALAHLAAGRADVYRERCRELLRRRGDTTDVEEAALVASLCVVRADAVDDWDRVVRLADLNVAAADARDGSAPMTKGVAEYRAGRVKEALPWFEKAERRAQELSSGDAYAFYFQAMAHHRLGHGDKAAECFRKAFRCSTSGGAGVGNWDVVLYTWLAQAEAEALMGEAAQALRGEFRRRPGPASLPGVIEAEDFDDGGEGVGYHKTDGPPFAPGWFYRPTPVGVEYCGDEGEGFNVGNNHTGEWLAYTLDVSEAGTYQLELRVACIFDDGRLHVEIDGADVTGPVFAPNTGGWQVYQTVVGPTVNLPAGRHVMRVVFDGAATRTEHICNLNWIRFDKSAGGE